MECPQSVIGNRVKPNLGRPPSTSLATWGTIVEARWSPDDHRRMTWSFWCIQITISRNKGHGRPKEKDRPEGGHYYHGPYPLATIHWWLAATRGRPAQMINRFEVTMEAYSKEMIVESVSLGGDLGPNQWIRIRKISFLNFCLEASFGQAHADSWLTCSLQIPFV